MEKIYFICSQINLFYGFCFMTFLEAYSLLQYYQILFFYYFYSLIFNLKSFDASDFVLVKKNEDISFFKIG